MNINYRVEQFHRTFGHPVAVDLTASTPKQAELRVKLIAEELCELAQALGVSLTIRCDSHNALVRVEKYTPDIDIVEVADAVGDLEVVVNGTAIVYGLPMDPILNEIMRSNYSKLDVDTKPILREDGKILRGPDYSPPDIAQVLRDNSGDPEGLLIN